jgi:hypothetical protein
MFNLFKVLEIIRRAKAFVWGEAQFLLAETLGAQAPE